MTRLLSLLIASVISIPAANAADAKIKVTLSQDEAGGSPTSTFSPDTPKLFAVFKGEGLHAGDKLRSVWIAEDVGDAAPKGTKIDEKTLSAESDTAEGDFALSKPTKGWPPGKYKLEIYVNENLVTTANFSISGNKETKPAAQPAAAGVPDEKELKSITDSAMVSFGEAIKDKDFSGFYLDIATVWQEQTSAEKLEEGFKDFYDKEIDLPAAIKGKEPVFEKPATIDANGVLVVQGYYPTKPNRVVFQLKFLKEEDEWKLVGVNVNLKE